MKSAFRRITIPPANFIKLLFKDKIEVAIFLTAFLVEMGLGLYLVYKWGRTYFLGGTFGGDLTAQLHISRTVIDNGEYSGLANLGTIWLPLSNLLRVPFVAIDVLYTTGLAGTIVNAIMTAGICCLMYRFVEEKSLGIIAASMFLTNIYTLALGASAFQEPTGLFFATLAVYYFKNYWEKDNLTQFMKCSVATILATLSRYEFWLVMGSITLLFIIKELKDRRVYRLAYAHLPLWGIFAWLFWNLAIFKDPFRWLRGGGSGYLIIATRVFAPRVDRVFTYSIPAMINISGFVLVLLPLLLLSTLALHRNHSKFGVILILLAPLILINLASWPGNERVLHTALPGIILAPMYLVNNGKRHAKFAIVSLLLVTYCLAIPTQYNVFVQAFYTRPAIPSPYYEEMASLKDATGDGSYVLMSAAGALSPGRSISVIYGISPSKIIDEYDSSLFAKASKTPWLYCEYIVIGKPSYFGMIFGFWEEFEIKAFLEAQHSYYGSHFEYLYYYYSPWREELLTHYKLIVETTDFLVFKRVD